MKSLEKIKMNEIVRLIKEYGLTSNISRDFPLFPLSFIGPAYTFLAKKIYGTFYRAVGAIGSKNKINVLLNAKECSQEVEKVIYSDFDQLFNVKIPKAKEFFEKLKDKIELVSGLEPKEALKIITDIYSDYWAYFEIYNSLMRYIGNNESKGKLTKEIIEKLSIERDDISKIYIKIEDIVATKTEELGKKLGFDGGLLKYMTKSELKEFLEKGKVDIKELEKRTKGYIYLFTGHDQKEQVITDQSIIEQVNDLFRVSNDISEFKGHTAHPGKITGIVRNLSTNKEGEINRENIIVASNTMPTDAHLISKAAGIVTDEGGILCHAATIARELKIPCVMGTKIASKVLKDGDLVEVDAEKGIVRKIKS
ncbi:hypothetical protein KY342_00105 [Candidatus Woesearchaeota archaeon]|nr:hypothetical protein [Candidatus Woesearchaeota archaeon]